MAQATESGSDIADDGMNHRGWQQVQLEQVLLVLKQLKQTQQIPEVGKLDSSAHESLLMKIRRQRSALRVILAPIPQQNCKNDNLNLPIYLPA